MKVIPFKQARVRLAQTMNEVCRDHEPVLITRQNGDPIVMLSLREFSSMEQTLYLTSTRNNSRRLRESIQQLQAGQVIGKRFPEVEEQSRKFPDATP